MDATPAPSVRLGGMIDVFVSKEPQNPNKPLLILEFPSPSDGGPGLELHVWMFEGLARGPTEGAGGTTSQAPKER